MIDLGVDILITDRPDPAKRLARPSGGPLDCLHALAHDPPLKVG